MNRGVQGAPSPLSELGRNESGNTDREPSPKAELNATLAVVQKNVENS
jgi:hypothetical protein